MATADLRWDAKHFSHAIIDVEIRRRINGPGGIFFVQSV
jgi:hypothetical protein